MRRVITIDGPSGAGKGTVAKILAGRLGFQYLDTGALYRTVALYLREQGMDEEASDEEVENILRGPKISFSNGKTFLKGRNVSDAIRAPEIGHYSSVFSARKPVRDFLLGVQRAYAEKYDTVIEGRDMGTIVFPEAWKKFFLDATQEERVRRRFYQLKEQGEDITMEIAMKDIRDRDERDSHRAIAPLKRAADAIYIDTTSIGIEDTVKKILEVL